AHAAPSLAISTRRRRAVSRRSANSVPSTRKTRGSPPGALRAATMCAPGRNPSSIRRVASASGSSIRARTPDSPGARSSRLTGFRAPALPILRLSRIFVIMHQPDPGVSMMRMRQSARGSPRGRLPGRAAPIALEELQQLRVRGQDEPRLLVQTAAQGLHRLHELVEVGVPAVGPRVDGGRLRVRDPLDLLGGFVAGGRSPEDIALFLAADLGGAPLALGAAPLGDALALRDHPLENLLLHALHVV